MSKVGPHPLASEIVGEVRTRYGCESLSAGDEVAQLFDLCGDALRRLCATSRHGSSHLLHTAHKVEAELETLCLHRR
jgi:hypothetical protein